jgi:hypothetical protein
LRRVNLGVALAHRLLLSAAVGLIVPLSVEGAAPPWQTARVVDVIPLVFAWTYEIETATEIVVATQHKKPCRITLEAPLRVAVEGDHVRLIDEAGREHEERGRRAVAPQRGRDRERDVSGGRRVGSGKSEEGRRGKRSRRLDL